MIIIPEIEKVMILVPRTGTSTLKKAIKEAYPNSFQPYRHMEACGVPKGYDRWEKLAVLRHPAERLWSLYNYLKTFESVNDTPEYNAAMQAQGAMEFDDWIINNRTIFTAPYDHRDGMTFWPFYTCNYPQAENLKSQYFYIRPDLGTRIFLYEHMGRLYDLLGIDMPAEKLNHTGSMTRSVKIGQDAMIHIQKHHGWDINTWNSMTFKEARYQI